MYRRTSGSPTSTHCAGEKPRKSDEPISPRSFPRSAMPTHSYGMPIGGRKCMIVSAISAQESREPPGRIRVAGSVLVDGPADLLRPRRQIADERLHLRIAVRIRRRHDPDTGREPVQDAAEILPEVLDPIRMAPDGIRHVDEPAA